MSDRKPVLYIDDEKCRNSYSCVRVCPVNAIEVKPQKAHPYILPDRCIGCGLCYVSCTPHAIAYRDSKEGVKALLSSDRKTAALIEPSIASEFDDITDFRKFVAMIRSLGFDYVHEVSFGVDLIAASYAKLFAKAEGKYFISANCPSIVKLIEKFHPEKDCRRREEGQKTVEEIPGVSPLSVRCLSCGDASPSAISSSEPVAGSTPSYTPRSSDPCCTRESVMPWHAAPV